MQPEILAEVQLHRQLQKLHVRQESTSQMYCPYLRQVEQIPQKSASAHLKQQPSSEQKAHWHVKIGQQFFLRRQQKDVHVICGIKLQLKPELAVTPVSGRKIMLFCRINHTK